MSGPKRKTTKQDWIFRAFVLICIFASYFVILKTKPERGIVGGTDIEVSVSSSDILHADLTSEDKKTSVTASVSDEEPATSTSEVQEPASTPDKVVSYRFRNNSLLTSHYEKHGIDMGFSSKEDYEAAASAVITNPAALHKIEAEDGDDIYYIESTNEFVVLSTDGYIRTYFLPDSGKKYFDKQ